LIELTHGALVLYRGGRFSYGEKEFRAHWERAMQRLMNGLRSEER